MLKSRQELETILQDRICRVCSDRNNAGTCGLEEPDTCALFRLLPQVVEAVASTTSDNIVDYISALRQQVCAVCREQDAGGDCEKRNNVECALDAYLMLVVDAIEEATGKLFDRRALVTPELTLLDTHTH
jgi:hypothetical protein